MPYSSYAVKKETGLGRKRFGKTYFFISLAYALMIANLPEITGKTFVDLNVYIENFSTHAYPVDVEGSFLKFYINEIFWRKTIYFLAGYYELEFIFKCLTFFISFVFSFVCLRLVNSFLVLVFLFNPIILDLEISQVRSGVAMSLLYIAYFSKPMLLATFFSIASIFTHSAMPVMIFIYLSSQKISWFTGRLRTTFVSYMPLLFGVAFSVLMYAGKSTILAQLGDRRAEMQGGSSGWLFSFLWSVLIIPLILRKKQSPEADCLAYFSMITLSLFLVSSVFGEYGSRYIALAYPVIIFSIFSLPQPFKLFSLLYLLVFQASHTYLWL